MNFEISKLYFVNTLNNLKQNNAIEIRCNNKIEKTTALYHSKFLLSQTL